MINNLKKKIRKRKREHVRKEKESNKSKSKRKYALKKCFMIACGVAIELITNQTVF